MPPKGTQLSTKPKYLLIAEKPSLMREIMKVYQKNNYPFELVGAHARGHLMRLKLPNELGCTGFGFNSLPFFPEKWEYIPIEDSKDLLKQIKETFKKGKFTGIIHAGDPEVEGELIIREVIDYIGAKCPVYRFFTNELTEKAISNALNDLKPLSTPLYERYYQTGLARQHSDYIVGMNYSPAYSDKLKTTVAAGRVMTFILGLLVQREIDIENFKDEVNYGVSAVFETKNNEFFKGQLMLKNGNKLEVAKYDTKKEAEDILSKNEKPAVVRNLKYTETEIHPGKFFKLSTLQAEAAKYGYSINDTLNILQRLYEMSYVTYPRTNCEYISGNEDLDKSIMAAKTFLQTDIETDKEKVLKNSNFVNLKKLESEGHTALMPTGILPKGLNKAEQAIYKLVCRRFLSAFLPSCKTRKTTALITSGENIYKAEGIQVLQAGFKQLYENSVYPNNAVSLPILKENDELNIDASVIEMHKQKPTPITDSELIKILDNPLSLVKDLNDPELLKMLKNVNDGESFTIGTQASRPGIITKLEKREYITHKKGRYEPTKTGRQIIEAIGFDSPLLNVLYTGSWEIELEKIREGNADRELFEQKVKEDIVEKLNEIKNKQFSIIATGEATSYVCPKCGNALVSTPGTLKCSCGFLFFKKTYKKMLSERQIGLLLGGEKVHVKGLKWEKDTFEADLQLDKSDYKVKRVKPEAFV